MGINYARRVLGKIELRQHYDTFEIFTPNNMLIIKMLIEVFILKNILKIVHKLRDVRPNSDFQTKK